ncbi:MAG TPA: heavy-metal-associated domain-containing protein [Sphingopyxis sp.]|nr:heavy-metal-associated domain-containing protein [Sphingopyxis sp.]
MNFAASISLRQGLNQAPSTRPASLKKWRWAALSAVAGAMLLGNMVDGQIARGNRGITPINSSADFMASGISVDVTAKNSNEARSEGWRQAQRLGWEQLYQRLNGTAAPKLSDSVLDGIVTAIVVEHEEIGARRYVAKLGVQFDRVRAGQILGVSGRMLRSPPMLVIPIYSIDGIQQVFEQRSPWQKAWAEFHTGQSAIDYVRTAGVGTDTLLLNAGQAGRRSRMWWRMILDQYGAADVLMPIARIEYSYPGGPIKGYFTARFGPDNVLIDKFTLTGTSPAVLSEMMEKAAVRMDQIYTAALSSGQLRTDTYLVLEKPVEPAELPDVAAENDALPVETDASTPPAAAVGVQSFNVQYSSPDVDSVSATERAVAAVAGVQSASTSSLALGGTSVMRVTFRGDVGALKAALAARGFAVQEGGGQLRISRK